MCDTGVSAVDGDAAVWSGFPCSILNSPWVATNFYKLKNIQHQSKINEEYVYMQP
jgi:hypothetical protein